MNKNKIMGALLGSLSIMGVTLSSNATAVTDRYMNPLENQVNGWQVANYFNTPQPITQMTANFNVPKNPKRLHDGQLDYFFPAITTSDWGYILQPVIKYNDTAAGNGLRGWSMSVWYLTPQSINDNLNNYHDADFRINPGDKIYVSFKKTNIKNKNGDVEWILSMRDITNGRGFTSLPTLPNVDYMSAWPAAMESYHIKKCGDLAGSPFTVNNFHVYNNLGKEMTTNAYQQYAGDESCRAKITSNSVRHNATITSDGNY